LLSPQVLAGYAKFLLRGERLGGGSQPRQLGGEFVIAADGRVAYSHPQRSVNYRPAVGCSCASWSEPEAMVHADGKLNTRRYWNERHAAATWREEPADWLLEQRELLAAQPRGRALDIACGGGRNTFFLAALGFEVDALDISDVAVARVQELTAQRGAPVTVQRTDLAAGASFPRSAYEVVIDFFFRERSLFAPTAQALAPGGLLVFETFVSARPEAPAKSFDPRFGLEPGELRRAFAALELLRYEEVQNGDESSGYRRVARLAARRPA